MLNCVYEIRVLFLFVLVFPLYLLEFFVAMLFFQYSNYSIFIKGYLFFQAAEISFPVNAPTNFFTRSEQNSIFLPIFLFSYQVLFHNHLKIWPHSNIIFYSPFSYLQFRRVEQMKHPNCFFSNHNCFFQIFGYSDRYQQFSKLYFLEFSSKFSFQTCFQIFSHSQYYSLVIIKL